MEMTLGKRLRVTIFGESHGKGVGALIQGIPPGILIDEDIIAQKLSERKPGRELASARKEPDICEIKSGIYNSKTTGFPLLLWIKNQDAKSKDYSFLPKIPRPGHADLPSHIRSEGNADLRGGGSHSGRLTAPLVAASGVIENLRKEMGFEVLSQVCSIGNINADSITKLEIKNQTNAMKLTNCKDEVAAEKMYNLIKSTLAGLFSAITIGALTYLTYKSTFGLFLIASFGSSMVLLYGYPESPFAQPKNIFFGHLLTSFVGVIFVSFIQLPLFIILPLAVGFGVGLMILFNVPHPPAGGNPIIVILGSVSFDYLLNPIMVGSIIIIAVSYTHLTLPTKRIV